MFSLSQQKIYLIFFTLSLLTTVYNRRLKFSPKYYRVIGGIVAENRYPFMVSLQLNSTKGFNHNCGGSIINERTIITAAHCVYYHETSSLRVHVGENSREVVRGEVFDVKAIHCHEKYVGTAYDYDVALLRIKGCFEFNDKIQPIELAKPHDVIIYGSFATIMGWGVTNISSRELPEDLMMARVLLIKPTTCSRYLGVNITPRMICAGFRKGGVDSCQMDSGGPLVYNDKLIGIVSWGSGCAQPKKPGVYAKVSEYLEWIENILLKKYCEVLEEETSNE